MKEGAIHWVAVVKIHDGQLEEFKARAEETIATAKANEPGQLVYEWHISPDGTTCHVDEWYADTEAALAHVRGEAVTEKLPKLLEVSDFAELWIYSHIEDTELRNALAAFGAAFWDHWGGHTR
jgi:quinol monooxygenase YgiN